MQNTHRFLTIALEIFEEIATGREKVSIQALADRHELSYASCYRIIRTFTEKGWIEEDLKGIYHSNPDLLVKIDLDREQEFIIETIRSEFNELVAKTELTGKLTIRQGEEAVSFYTLASPRPNSVFTKRSSRFHLAAGSSGACLMSDLSDEEVKKILKSAPDHYWRNQNEFDVFQRLKCVRETGVAFDLGATSPHFSAASTPLVYEKGRVAAAITLVGFPSDFDASHREPIRRELLSVSKAFSDALVRQPENSVSFAI